MILAVLGVPMALVLGLIAAILAFIPNVGAFITGVLMTAVGFSAGVDTGLYALATYFVVQTFDGYVVIPMVAKRRSEEHTSELQSLMRISYAVFCLKKQNHTNK